MRTVTTKGNPIDLIPRDGEVKAVATTSKGTLRGVCRGYTTGVVVKFPAGTAMAVLDRSDWEALQAAARQSEPQAVKAWRKVQAAVGAAEDAESSSYYDPSKICRLRSAAEQAERDFAEQHPGAYAEKMAAQESRRLKEEQRREREYRSSFIGQGLD